uniref:Uncharacterized protein n=1 Tax=Photinus pyralis TaxID=7054 RepID=A0A1Y1NKE9_PHOPY
MQAAINKNRMYYFSNASLLMQYFPHAGMEPVPKVEKLCSLCSNTPLNNGRYLENESVSSPDFTSKVKATINNAFSPPLRLSPFGHEVSTTKLLDRINLMYNSCIILSKKLYIF